MKKSQDKEYIPDDEKIRLKKGYKFYDADQRYKWFDLRNLGKVFHHNSPSRTLLVNMELNTGFHRSFFVDKDAKSFDFEKRTYIIDLSLMYYNIDAGYWSLDYHESFIIPIRRRIPIDEIKAGITASGMYSDIENATNPSNVKQFMNSNIIEQIIAGAQLSKKLRLLVVLAVISLIVLVLHFIAFVIKSGMLNEAKKAIGAG